MEKKTNNIIEIGGITRCRGYITSSGWFVNVPIEELVLVKAVEVKKFDGSSSVIELIGNVVDGYKFTISGKDKKQFTVILSASEIVQHQGHSIYIDNHGTPREVPKNAEKIKVVVDRNGKFREFVKFIDASRWTRTGKDGTSIVTIIPNADFIFANQISGSDGKLIGYVLEKPRSRRS